MKRASLFLLTSLGAIACCAQAVALGVSSSSASTGVNARIVARPVGIQVVSPLVLPSVTASAVSPNASFAGAVPSAGTNGTTAGVSNATLTIRGQAGDAVSMAVPESFTVVRNGGTEALTVRTNTSSELGIEGDGVVLGGAVMGSNTMSVNVGGALSLASSDRLEPGAYEGLLVVVVQYN